MRRHTPIGLLAALLVALAACGADSDDGGSVGPADTGADVPFSPLQGQWEGTIGLVGTTTEIEVWVHFDLESGGALGLPCDYDEVDMGRSIGSDTNWTMQFRYRGNRVYEVNSGRHEGNRQRVSLRGFGDCSAQGSGHIYP